MDIYPAGDARPVRLEFIGDTIESLRTYDPGTQRSIKPIDQLTVIPLNDVLSADPDCAMVYWAKAVSSFDNPLGSRPGPKREKEGWAAVEKAKQMTLKT